MSLFSIHKKQKYVENVKIIMESIFNKISFFIESNIIMRFISHLKTILEIKNVIWKK